MVKQTTTFAKPVTSVVQPISSPVLDKLSAIPIVGDTVAKLGTASGLGISNLDGTLNGDFIHRLTNAKFCVQPQVPQLHRNP